MSQSFVSRKDAFVSRKDAKTLRVFSSRGSALNFLTAHRDFLLFLAKTQSRQDIFLAKTPRR